MFTIKEELILKVQNDIEIKLSNEQYIKAIIIVKKIQQMT